MAMQFPDVWYASAGMTRSAAWDMTKDLDDSETLSGTPTITEVTTADLTIASKVVNSSAITVKENEAAIGKAVQCKISGFVSGTTYTVRVSVATSAGDTLVYDQIIVTA